MTHARSRLRPHTAMIALLLGMLGAGLGGCTFTTPPVIEVQSVSVVERTDEAVVLAFTLIAHNNNEEPIPLKLVDYHLELGGKTVFSGERSSEATLRRQGTHTILLPAPVPPSSVASGVVYRIEGSIEYQDPGTLTLLMLDLGFSLPTTKFSSVGTIDSGGGSVPPAPPN